MKESEAPLVPDLRGKHEVSLEKPDVDKDDIKKEIEHLRKEVPFVPVVEERRDKNFKKAKEEMEQIGDDVGVADLRRSD